MPSPRPHRTPAASPERTWIIAGVLALLSIFPPIATDMYLSAMGDLATAMQASDAATGLSLSLFFLGLCVGQLVMGPLIDAYGRKLPLLAGIVLFTVTSMGLLLTDDIAVFNTLRFFQAIGACAGMVTGRAVVSDLYAGQQAAKMMTVLVMLMTLGPIISPSAGSLLSTRFGWRSIFITMVVVGCIALVLTKWALPETLPPERRSARPFAQAVTLVGLLLRRPAFMLPALVAGLIQGAMFAFISGSSATFQQGFGLTSLQYGLLFGCVAAALVLFGQVNNWLLARYEPHQILNLGLPVLGVAGLSLVLSTGASSLWLVVAPLWLSIGLVGLLTANAMSLTMEGSPEGAGMGSAVLGALQFGIAFLVSSGVAMGSNPALAMALGVFVPGLMACLAWLGWRTVLRP